MREILYLNKLMSEVAEDNLMRGSSLRRLGAALRPPPSLAWPPPCLFLLPPNCIVPDYFPLCRITLYCVGSGCIFARPQPLYRGVSWRQRTAAAELAMPGCRAPPGVSIEKLAAPPTSTSIPPFLHLAADMARQEPRSRCSREEAGEDKVF